MHTPPVSIAASTKGANQQANREPDATALRCSSAEFRNWVSSLLAKARSRSATKDPALVNKDESVTPPPDQPAKPYLIARMVHRLMEMIGRSNGSNTREEVTSAPDDTVQATAVRNLDALLAKLGETDRELRDALSLLAGAPEASAIRASSAPEETTERPRHHDRFYALVRQQLHDCNELLDAFIMKGA